MRPIGHSYLTGKHLSLKHQGTGMKEEFLQHVLSSRAGLPESAVDVGRGPGETRENRSVRDKGRLPHSSAQGPGRPRCRARPPRLPSASARTVPRLRLTFACLCGAACTHLHGCTLSRADSWLSLPGAASPTGPSGLRRPGQHGALWPGSGEAGEPGAGAAVLAVPGVFPLLLRLHGADPARRELHHPLPAGPHQELHAEAGTWSGVGWGREGQQAAAGARQLGQPCGVRGPAPPRSPRGQRGLTSPGQERPWPQRAQV